MQMDAQKILRVADLPAAVQATIKTTLDAMSDADGAYQVGCVIEPETSEPQKIKIDPKINAARLPGIKPLHRLIFGAMLDNGHKTLVHFESGGFMHTFSLRLYDSKSGDLIWGSYVPEKFFEVEKANAYLVENFGS